MLGLYFGLDIETKPLTSHFSTMPEYWRLILGKQPVLECNPVGNRTRTHFALQPAKPCAMVTINERVDNL